MQGTLQTVIIYPPATNLKRHLYLDYTKNSPNLTVKRQPKHFPYICTQMAKKNTTRQSPVLPLREMNARENHRQHLYTPTRVARVN